MRGVLSLLNKFIRIRLSNKSNKENLYKKELFYFLKEKGGVYNKFLQVLCITHKFMEGWSGTKEFLVYNQAKQEYINLDNILPNKEKYKYISQTPIAVGSFAQVYEAITNDEKHLAIKILKPSVRTHLKHDLKLLHRIVKLVSLFASSSIIDFNAAIEEFNEICLTETDYEREIYNLEYFRDLYKDHKYVVIPEVYRELSNNYVIAQDFIEGINLADILTNYNGDDLIAKANSLTGSNIITQLSIIGGELLRCAISKEFVYGDPHPGNIILLNDNKVAYIDFGIVGRKPLSQRAFYDWTKSYYNFLNLKNTSINEFSNLIDTTCKCFCPDFLNALNCCTDNRIVSMITDAITKKLNREKSNNDDLSKLINDGHMFTVFNEFMNSKNVFCLSIDMRNFPLLKAMQAYICTISTIDKRFKTNNFQTILTFAMDYAFEAIKNDTVPYDYVENSKYSKSDALELIDTMLASLAEGDEFLFQNIYKEMIK